MQEAIGLEGKQAKPKMLREKKRSEAELDEEKISTHRVTHASPKVGTRFHLMPGLEISSQHKCGDFSLIRLADSSRPKIFPKNISLLLT